MNLSISDNRTYVKTSDDGTAIWATPDPAFQAQLDRIESLLQNTRNHALEEAAQMVDGMQGRTEAFIERCYSKDLISDCVCQDAAEGIRALKEK